VFLYASIDRLCNIVGSGFNVLTPVRTPVSRRKPKKVSCRSRETN
jgi:hypothetical protein